MVGHGTSAESYRGIDGGVSVAPDTPDPDPSESNGYHLNASISDQQLNSQHPGGVILSQVGWQMGLLVQLPSGINTWSHTPTVFFEGLDNVADYRATYGPAETLGRYEVSWGGISPTGRHKYIAWYMRLGNWNQAGYAELDNQYSDANAIGEASDTNDPSATCIRLSSSSTNLHELGSPVALFLLTNGWYDWTSAFGTSEGLDNGRPYRYTNYSYPNYDHIGVGGP